MTADRNNRDLTPVAPVALPDDARVVSARYQLLTIAYVGIAALIAIAGSLLYGVGGIVGVVLGFGAGFGFTLLAGREALRDVAREKYREGCGSTRAMSLNIALGAALFVLGTVLNVLFLKAMLPDSVNDALLGAAIGGVFAACCGVIAARYFVGARTVREGAK